MHFLHLRDIETAKHTRRVANLTVEFSRVSGQFNEDELKDLYFCALIHDLGKMAVPDAILKKKGRLSRKEMKVIQMHPQYTYDLFFVLTGFDSMLEIAYCHHEKWDGTGYPRRLMGEAIPLKARLFAIVDVWDALTSDRCYRPAWTEKQAFQYIQEQSGAHFDPAMVNLFTQNFHLFRLAQSIELNMTCKFSVHEAVCAIGG
jgi:HD-GYP domain-containing protein (c-di-GMP phosphodiesterase class II)